jgi:signal peptidase I
MMTKQAQKRSWAQDWREGGLRQVALRLWREWRVAVLFILFVVVPVRSSLADWNWVPTGSMNPTILNGDLIYVNKLAYDLRIPLTMHRLAQWSEPQPGDVVVHFSPEDGQRMVKRVVAGPGDTVEMRHNTLLLNGQPLAYAQPDEDYRVHLPQELASASLFALEQLGETVHPVMTVPGVSAVRDFGPILVPDDHYFVLGDNRDLSRDSRYFGLVPRDSIVGKARAVIVSFDITDRYQPRLGRFFSPLQ